MARRDTLVMPYSFIGDETFRLLQFHSGEDAAPLLGRLIMLASVVATQNRVKFHVAEIDSLTAWRSPISFASILEKVGWASAPEKLVVRLQLPEALQRLTPRVIAGKSRVEKSERDDKGRWKRAGASANPEPERKGAEAFVNPELFPEEEEKVEEPKPERYKERPKLTVDSEGNVIAERPRNAAPPAFDPLNW